MERQGPSLHVVLTSGEEGRASPVRPACQALLLRAGALAFSEVLLSGPLGCVSSQLGSSPAKANAGHFLESHLGLSRKLRFAHKSPFSLINPCSYIQFFTLLGSPP